MILASQIKVQTGQVVITPNALGKLSSDDILNALNRHLAGDWGDLDKDDKLENDMRIVKPPFCLDKLEVGLTLSRFHPKLRERNEHQILHQPRRANAVQEVSGGVPEQP